MNHPSSALPTNLWESWHEDEVVEELHRHRAAVAELFDCDLERMFEYYAGVPVDPHIAVADIQPVTPNTAETNPKD